MGGQTTLLKLNSYGSQARLGGNRILDNRVPDFSRMIMNPLQLSILRACLGIMDCQIIETDEEEEAP